ncbi:hypothetical protein C8Q77DRAFT_1217966 [Trametes polyzona]|nr:hypothetical protein C8Q77DRAFT_1217966 [Trametes polyzona]
MSSLADHIDRLSGIALSIRAAASPPPRSSIPGTFTRAILDTPLGDLIRDIDPSEIGLFTLVEPQKPIIADVEPTNVEIGRVEFLGATPLRKPPSSRHAKPDGPRPREHDPEVYANAALKYLDRYQSIRPMPRASEQAIQILERLEEVRANIHALSEQLKQHPSADAAGPPLSPKSAIKAEERQIEELQSQIQYLKERKEELARKKSRPPPKAKREPKTPVPATPASPPDAREDTFWNTPGTAARTLHFTGDSLLDEEMDINDVSAASFGTPLIPQKQVDKLSRHELPARQTSHADPETNPSQPPPPGGDGEDEEEEVESVLGEDDGDVDEADETAEPTVVLGKAPLSSPPGETRPPSPPETKQRATEPPPDAPQSSTLASSHRSKVKVTTELERIVEKMWATVGEIIMPGHPFDALGKSTNKSKPPRAKETMAYLQELSSHSPTPASPSASSFSSLSGAAPSGPGAGPTAQQILTAHMLLALLGAPGYALTLRVLKETLGEKASSIGAAGTGLLGGSAVTKPVYGCVAKRLLKIERGGGEQVVKFDL